MNMLILKLGDTLSFELQRWQLYKSGILTVLYSICVCLCAQSCTVSILICVFMQGSMCADMMQSCVDVLWMRAFLGPLDVTGANICVLMCVCVCVLGVMLVLEECFPPRILICLPTFILAGCWVHVPDSFNWKPCQAEPMYADAHPAIIHQLRGMGVRGRVLVYSPMSSVTDSSLMCCNTQCHGDARCSHSGHTYCTCPQRHANLLIVTVTCL